jgi:tetrahydromethanopterin S-methyltransferase subunit A
MNVFHEACPDAIEGQALGCALEVKAELWPPVPGEYVACCTGQDSFVAISTLGSVELVEQLANLRPKELCIVGKTETENS